MNGEVQEELAVKCNNLKDELPKTREKFRKLQLRVISITMFSFPLSVARPPLTGLRDYTQTHHTRQDSSGRMISPTQKPLPDNTQHSQETNIHFPAEFGPTRSASERPQAHAFDSKATGID